jgi:hypothetical protein
VKRREFISLLGGAATTWPLAARAQQAGKTYRIGWLQPAAIPDAWLKGFRQGLQELDYVEGKNLIIEYLWGNGNLSEKPSSSLIPYPAQLLISAELAPIITKKARLGGIGTPQHREGSRVP